MAENPISQLIKVIEKHISRSTELTIEIKTLLKSMLQNINNSHSKDAKAEVKLDSMEDNLKDILKKVDTNQNTVQKALSAVYNKLSNKLSNFNSFDQDRCTSANCPKNTVVEELKDHKKEIVRAYEESKESYENREKWYKRALITVSILAIVFAIGMILTAAMGDKGLDIWFNQVLPKAKGM